MPNRELSRQRLEGAMVRRADDLKHLDHLDYVRAAELLEDIAQVDRLTLPEVDAQDGPREELVLGADVTEDRLGIAIQRLRR